MSRSGRSRITSLLGIALTLFVGCGGPGSDQLPASEDGQTSDEASAFDLPPIGTMGTPADDVTDPVLNNLPNPNPAVITNWGRLPDGREWGSSADVDIGPDGHIWTYDRCGNVSYGLSCEDSLLDPIVKLDRNTGEPLTSFGGGSFIDPHGIHVDSVGNVWVTDSSGNEEGTKGHQVIKFSPEGEIVMRLGTAGVPGSGPNHFNQPCDVVTAPNGDIFVADGHDGQDENPPPGSTGRIMKFAPNGDFIMEWGRIGNAPGEFRTPHSIAMDSQGRLFVGDRGNNRIQIFDQEGNYVDSYYQYSRPSGIFITPDDRLYVIDAETWNPVQAVINHPGWINGIRIGSALEDRVTGFIPPYPADDSHFGLAGQGVAADADGNVYAAEGPQSRPVVDGAITKYVSGM